MSIDNALMIWGVGAAVVIAFRNNSLENLSFNEIMIALTWPIRFIGGLWKALRIAITA